MVFGICKCFNRESSWIYIYLKLTRCISGSVVHGSINFSYNRVLDTQLLPPVVDTELITADFLSSIFIDWLSALGSILDTAVRPITVLLGFIPLDIGIRVVEQDRVDCTSVPDCKEKKIIKKINKKDIGQKINKKDLQHVCYRFLTNFVTIMLFVIVVK